MEACFFVASSEGSKPTLIWRPTHHYEATASANNAINFSAAAADDDDDDDSGGGGGGGGGDGGDADADGNDKTNKNSPVLTVCLSPKVQV